MIYYLSEFHNVFGSNLGFSVNPYSCVIQIHDSVLFDLVLQTFSMVVYNDEKMNMKVECILTNFAEYTLISFIAPQYFLGFCLNLVFFLVHCPKGLLTFCQACQEHLE
jgi:hypothetical protein